MKNKLITLTVALIFVFAMAIPTFAATLPSQGYVETSDTTLTISVPLTVKNPVLTTVKAPALAYNFTVSPVAPAANNGGTTIGNATVKTGATGGLSVSTQPAWTNATNVGASSTGSNNDANLVLTATMSAFSQPGVYRYSLTDATTNATVEAVGVTKPQSYNDTRYVDVYIERNSSDALVVKGYSVHDASGNKNTFAPYLYETYNIQVSVEATGTMADKLSSIFRVAVTQTGSSRSFYAGTAAPSSNSALNVTSGTFAENIAHGGVIYLAGLSAVDRIAYDETITTGDNYTVTHSINSGESVSGASIDSTAVTSLTTAKFTNTLNSISPTGFVMRYGPYVGMVLIALAIIYLKIKSKK